MADGCCSDLLKRAQRDDSEALEELCSHVNKDIKSVILNSINRPEVANELIQEVYFRFLKYYKGIKSAASLKSYVKKITHTVINDHYRYIFKYRDTFTVLESPELIRGGITQNYEQDYHHKLMLNYIIQSTSNSLDRNILQMKRQGDSYQEISTKLDITIGQAKMRYKRAICNIASRLA